MKQFFFLLAILLASCTSERLDTDTLSGAGEVTVLFKVDLPEAKPVGTRAINENLITDLQLLVFDENGRFLSRHPAVLGVNGYTATLPQSQTKRIVHFIANYSWTAFNDAASVGKDEGELIPPLQATNLTFWQRKVFASGLSAPAFAAAPVAMVRNMVKFTLTNQPASGLTNVTFALFNLASAGSVAPFNTVDKTFEGVVTEPAGVSFTTASAFGTAEVYAFERKNASVTTQPTYVIVRGTYGGATCYYKIDLIDEGKNMYDLQRNVWFAIEIQSVTLAGYATLEAAQSAPASNNISASVLLQSYPTISDGSYVLSVDKTVVSFTTNGQTLRANASYKTVGGVTQNGSITVTLVQDANFPVVNGAASYNPATGSLTASINNVPTGGVSYFATLKIEAGVLSRTIRLRLHAPFVFTNIRLTPAVVNNVQAFPVTLKFTVPAETDYLLPYNCFITSAYLTPVFGNIEVIHENGLYKYKWRVTSVGEQTINFTTNTSNAAETLFLEADLFQRGQAVYANAAGVSRFSNVVITPNPVNFGVNNAVALKFTVPTAGTYKIYTSNLTPVNGTAPGGIYTHTATAAGEQVIYFITNKQNVAETLRLTGTGYVDHSVALKNQLVTLSGILTYGSSNAVVNAGVVTVSVGTKVVGIFTTSAAGAYQVSIEANLGDVLRFSYTRSSTYTATQTLTSALMTVTKKLL